MNFGTTDMMQMVSFGEQLIETGCTHPELVNQMIQKFYPDADRNMLNQMLDWAKYPTLHLVSFKKLKAMAVAIVENKFKSSISTQVISQTQLDQHNGQKVALSSGTCWAYKPTNNIIIDINKTKWNKLTQGLWSEANGYWQTNLYDIRIPIELTDHIRFVNIIQSIWLSRVSTIATNVSQLDQKQIQLAKAVQETQAEYSKLLELVSDLRSNYSELQHQTMTNSHMLKSILPSKPKYDYAEIKSRKKTLHMDLRRTCRLMRII